MNTHEIANIFGSYREKNNINRNSFLGKELTIILSILDNKKIYTVEHIKNKGPLVLSKAYPGLSVNRVNFLYEVIGEDKPFEYIDSILVKPAKKLMLKDKYK